MCLLSSKIIYVLLTIAQRKKKMGLHLFNYLLCSSLAQRTKATMVNVVKQVSLCLWEQFLQQASEIISAAANISPMNVLLIQRASTWLRVGHLPPCEQWRHWLPKQSVKLTAFIFIYSTTVYIFFGGGTSNM